MTEIQESMSIIKLILKEVEKFTYEGETGIYILDPVFGVVRNRVHAEIAKTYFRLNCPEKGIQLIKYILSQQSEDGSWNEIHPHYNQKSALITAFIGSALIAAYPFFPQDDALEKAKNYVLKNENNGYFLKSCTYTADHLNVDASCGAFLAEYGELFADQYSIDVARRAAKRVCKYQKNGYFPYTTDKGNYSSILDVPCIHYQAVTIYYLLKINTILKDQQIEDSILAGASWLASKQRSNGSFDWSESGLMFAYYLSGANAFAYSSFSYAARYNMDYNRNASLCLKCLEKDIRGIMLRWEKSSWYSFISSPFICLKTATIGNFPFKEKMFRFGYGMYRQIARRRFSENVDPQIFHHLCLLLGIQASTVEASNNYPDLFMTSEVLDCLSYTSAHNGEYK